MIYFKVYITNRNYFKVQLHKLHIFFLHQIIQIILTEIELIC